MCVRYNSKVGVLVNWLKPVVVELVLVQLVNLSSSVLVSSLRF